MMRVTPKLFLLFCLVAAASNGWSQTDQKTKPAADSGEPKTYYRLDFVIKELEGSRQISTRTYTLTAAIGGSGCSVRVGDKIPTSTGKDQYTYLDVGVSLDCRDLRELEGKLALRIQADISAAASQDPAALSAAPVVRQFRWASDVLIPLRKPTIVYRSDSASSKNAMELELTATPLQ